MAFNRKELKVEPTTKKNQNPYSKDVIVDPQGQWKYPGEITKIPSNQITMEGVPYPVLGEDNLGNQQMMYPGMNYTFPGDNVTEYPQIDEARYGGLKKRRSTSNPAVGINDLMLRNPHYHTKKHLYFVPSKEQGGSMNKDDSFYVSHEDAARLRATTPINFVNTPYYNLGGPSDGPLGYFGDGGGKKKGAMKPAEPVNPNYVTDSMATVNYAAQHPELFNPNLIQYGVTDAGIVQKFPMKNGVKGRPQNIASKRVPTSVKNEYKTIITDPKYAGAENEKALKWSMNELEKNNSGEGGYQPFPGLFGVPPEMQEGGNPSPMNYGAFPVMAAGGEFTMIINDLLRKQFGGIDTKNQAPSTDGIIEDNKNFFNSYIRNNVGKALAEEMKNEFQQQMMAGAYMQDGGPFTNPYANADTGITANNENLSYQMQGGGSTGSPENDAFWAGNPAMSRKDVTAQSTECSPMEKMDPNSQCYDPNFSDQGTAQGKQHDVQSNNPGQQMAMPDAPSPYFSSQPPSYGKELVGATPQQDVGTWDMNNPNAPQAPAVQNWSMDPNQTRTQEPTENSTGGKQGKPFDWQSMMPSGMDMANNILGTMDFITNRLDARQNKKQEKANKWRYSGDANFVAKPQTSSSRGDYDVNSGMFRPDQYVPVQFRGNNMGNVGSPYYTAQYGGSGFNEDQEVYMSDEDIQQYLAAGGQVEFLD